MLALEHTPVLLKASLELLAPRPGAVFIDATVGGGGHAAALLERLMPDGRLLGLDADPEAVAHATVQLTRYGDRVRVRQANFRLLDQVAAADGFAPADGILLDLGVSSRQLDGGGRGFSFQRDEPLDMRFDPARGVSAAELLAALERDDLVRVLRSYGEEPRARRIADRIVARRRSRPVATTGELAGLVEAAVGGRHGRTHPATRTFQALRIAVNDELGALEAALTQALGLLRPGGRLAVIAFHSLEDRVVKRALRAAAGRSADAVPRHLPIAESASPPSIRLVTPRPVTPAPEEIARNPRSRSARLRVAEKL